MIQDTIPIYTNRNPIRLTRQYNLQFHRNFSVVQRILWLRYTCETLNIPSPPISHIKLCDLTLSTLTERIRLDT